MFRINYMLSLFLRFTTDSNNFNYVYARTRQIIERIFILLKGKFKRLKFLDMNRDDMIAYVITTCCVLHKFYLSGIVDNVEDFS